MNSNALRPDKIPVIVDVPRVDPGLGFEKYVDAVAGAIIGGEPAQYTVGLYGPWGTGKSSILLALMARLDGDDNVTAVHFDAWRHERADNLLGPLVYLIHKKLGAKRGFAEKWKKILGGLELNAFGFGFRLPAEADRSEGVKHSIVAYMDGVNALATVGETIEEGRRVVVLVDDLDRCTPGRVLEVIEAIRLVMDVPGFIFVLAIDYDVLIRAVETRYPHADAHQFVEKIVQVPFRIPSLSSSGAYLEQIVPGWSDRLSVWFQGIDDSQVASLTYLALRDNPRQVKRVLNAFMVAKHIDWVGLHSAPKKSLALLELLALQAAWPGAYLKLVAGMAAYDRAKTEESMPPNAVLGAVREYAEIRESAKNSEDESLQRLFQFLDRHLTGSASFMEVFAASRMASESILGDSRVASGAPDQKTFFGLVVKELTSLPCVSLISSNETLSLAELKSGDHLVRLVDVRSRRGSFVLVVPSSAVDLNARVYELAQSPEAWERKGDTDRFLFGDHGGATLVGAIEEARKVLQALAGEGDI